MPNADMMRQIAGWCVGLAVFVAVTVVLLKGGEAIGVPVFLPSSLSAIALALVGLAGIAGARLGLTVVSGRRDGGIPERSRKTWSAWTFGLIAFVIPVSIIGWLLQPIHGWAMYSFFAIEFLWGSFLLGSALVRSQEQDAQVWLDGRSRKKSGNDREA